MVKDGYFRMFVRWLYETVLDEPYIPKGVSVRIKRPDGNVKSVLLKWPPKFPQRRGVLDVYIYKTFSDIQETEYR